MQLNDGFFLLFPVIQVNYLNSPPGTLDWAQGGTWYRGYGVYLLALTLYNINANYLYWVIATMATDPRDIVRLAGFLRGVEGAGGAGGFGSTLFTIPSAVLLCSDTLSTLH